MQHAMEEVELVRRERVANSLARWACMESARSARFYASRLKVNNRTSECLSSQSRQASRIGLEHRELPYGFEMLTSDLSRTHLVSVGDRFWEPGAVLMSKSSRRIITMSLSVDTL